jgi:hypothetical protein
VSNLAHIVPQVLPIVGFLPGKTFDPAQKALVQDPKRWIRQKMMNLAQRHCLRLKRSSRNSMIIFFRFCLLYLHLSMVLLYCQSKNIEFFSIFIWVKFSARLFRLFVAETLKSFRTNVCLKLVYPNICHIT